MTSKELLKIVNQAKVAADPLRFIEKTMISAIREETGAIVELTFYAKNEISMSADEPNHLESANKIMVQAGLVEIDRADFFNEDGYGLIYYRF